MRGLRDLYHGFNQRDGPREAVLASLAAHSAIHDEAVLSSVGMHSVDPNGSLNLTSLKQIRGKAGASIDQMLTVVEYEQKMCRRAT